ncbi:MAG: CdaR family protein [Trueperaceae bacterium]|nr:CdaR family protein [Trueperaceae bacterium]
MIRTAIRKLLDQWPQKLGALVVASLLWLFVSTDDTTIAQITLSVPLAVEGLGSNQLTTGIPDQVDVTLTGPSNRVDTLRPESIDAVLNLRDVSGSFEQSIRVFPPQGLTLQGVRPSVVIGTIETKVSSAVPVAVAPFGTPPGDARRVVTPLVEQVTATGRRQQVERVSQAIGVVRGTSGSATAYLYAADETGQMVSNVSLSPSEVEVTFSEQPILHTKRVPVVIELPDVSPLRVAEQNLSQDTLRVAGSREQLDALDTITATVEFATSTLIPGRYTPTIRPQLPDDVIALESLRVTLRLAEGQ